MTKHLALSAGQKALWFLHRLAPDSAAYNVVTVVRIRTVLNLPQLERAVHALAWRHEMIRSVFTEVDGEPCRMVRGPRIIRLEVRDIREAGDIGEAGGIGDIGEAGERYMPNAAVAEACRLPFRLAAGEPPCRLVWFRLASGDGILALVVHHIATDATSQWLLLADLLDEYRKAAGDHQAAGPDQPGPPAGSYDAYVEEERHFLASPERARAAAFWRAECVGAIGAELPADRPRPDRRAFEGATHKLVFRSKSATQVRAAARSAAVTPFGFLAGAFTALLCRYTGADDLVIGCAATARSGRAMRDVVGYLVNPIVVRVRMDAGGTFADAAREANSSVTTGLRHARYPFPVLVEDAGLPRRAGRTPMFQITFTMIEPSPLAPLSRLLPMASALGPEMEYAGIRLAQLDVPQMEGQFDLSVEVRQQKDELVAVFRYSTDIFTSATIERLARHYERLVEVAVSDPETPIANVTLMDNAELDEVLSFGLGIK
ncbi:MAG TPA: condensation domain-containing protein [Streptosporangiaceae bacterium]